MRENMLIYRSFYEAIKDLPLEDQAQVWNAIFELGLNQNEIQLTGIASTIFKLVKPQIEANIRRFQNGKAPKKQNESKTEADVSKTVTNKNNNNNLNNNLTLSNRKEKFYTDVSKFIDLYDKKMLREFFDYWTEHAKEDKKMRFEKEKSFGIDRRLKTWKTNQEKYKPFNNSTSFDKTDKLVDFVNQQIAKK
jgi:hypothetical protein